MADRILITGGAGYIGSNLADKLVEGGAKVVIVDDLSTGKLKNIDHLVSSQKVEFIKGTILDEGLMQKLIERVDLVYHLAAAVGVKHIVNDPLRGILTNVHGTEIVLRLAMRLNKRILLASTSEIYGKSRELPFKEDGERVLGPTSVNRWSYSTSKALDEHLAFAYAQLGLRVSVVRYFNSYGPRIDEQGYGSVVAQFIRQALANEPLTVYGRGDQTRCFTFVDDTVTGTILAATSDKAVGRVINIGNNQETKVLDLAKLIKKLTNSKSDIIFKSYDEAYGQGFEDTQRRVPDIQLASKLFGYQPRFELVDGLAKTIAWCKENYSK